MHVTAESLGDPVHRDGERTVIGGHADKGARERPAGA